MPQSPILPGSDHSDTTGFSSNQDGGAGAGTREKCITRSSLGFLRRSHLGTSWLRAPTSSVTLAFACMGRGWLLRPWEHRQHSYIEQARTQPLASSNSVYAGFEFGGCNVVSSRAALSNVMPNPSLKRAPAAGRKACRWCPLSLNVERLLFPLSTGCSWPNAARSRCFSCRAIAF